MASTLTQVYIHVIFHVKTTASPMRDADLPRIFSYIGGIVRGIGGVPVAVGGVCDHVHVLSSLPKTMAVSEFAMKIKGESSKWIKSLDDWYIGFAWQEGYGAFSVSQSVLEKTQEYVNRQSEHHKKRSFADEYKALLVAYGVEFDERYAFAD